MCVYLCSGPEKILSPSLPPGMTYIKKDKIKNGYGQ
jgi:hypothetical protein